MSDKTDSITRAAILKKFSNAATKNYRDVSREVGQLPSPTQDEIDSPEFNAIYDIIKYWDVDLGDGPCGANGSHVKLILDKLKPVLRGEKLKKILK